MEDELGVQILVRHGKRVVDLTEPGRIIVDIADRTRAETDRAEVLGRVCPPEPLRFKGWAAYNVSMDVELIAPIAMDDGLRFAIREGGRTVGAGVVASIVK